MSDLPLPPGIVAAVWDGRRLALQRRNPGRLALRLDGADFCRWTEHDGTELVQDFAFAPGGHGAIQLQLASELCALHAPWQVKLGQVGIEMADGAAAGLAPLDASVEHAADLARLTRAAECEVVVVVPIYNAVAEFTRCLEALARHRQAGVRLILIDDASTEPGIGNLLDRARQWPETQVLRNDKNMGFTATVNRGMALANGADVVLLNADTEVGAGWLAGLRRAAWSADDIGSATAVSDNAGAFSVPELEQDNPLPPGWILADAVRSLRQDAGLNLPELPTGNGFCMYIRAEALAEAGLFDAQAFPEGYGEENDWSQRAAERGWRHVIAGFVFVAHARSSSFGAERRERLGRAGMEVLRQRYPRYEADVGANLFSFRRKVLDWRVRRLWRGPPPRPRILLGSHAPDAGLEGEIWRVEQSGTELVLRNPAGTELERADASASDASLALWLQRHGIEAMAGTMPLDPALGALLGVQNLA